MQTLIAPIISSMLYLIIFAEVLTTKMDAFDGVSYTEFLIPGLIMMSAWQNAFANTSSSIVHSKIIGNIVFILLPPISALSFFLAHVAAALVRGILIGFSVFLCSLLFTDIKIENPLLALYFLTVSCVMAASLGIISGLWAEKFDHMSGFQNFIILPLTFLGGVFYSINTLPEHWQTISIINPFFYIIDGFRYSFFLQSDRSISISFLFISVGTIIVSTLSWWLVHIGYKIRT